jgi:protein DGCR14
MPSPGPSVLGDSGISSLMTFGTLASTPVALRDPNASDPAFRVQAVNDAMKEGPFRIPHTPHREVLAHKMASKATKSLQQRQGGPQTSGLGLRRSGTPGSVARLVRAGTPGGGWGSTPKDDAVREARRAMQDEGRTPSRDAFLSPAAKTLLGRTTNHQKQQSTSSYPFQQGEANGNKRYTQDTDRMERYKRAKWDPSPLGR